jgi:mitogen-activated protein kinase organizer 1
MFDQPSAPSSQPSPSSNVPCRLQRSLVTASTAASVSCGSTGSAASICFDTTGRYVLVASGRCVRLWNASAGLLIQTYTDHGYDISSVASSSCGERFASAAGRSAFVYDVATGVSRKYSAIANTQQRVNAVCFAGLGHSLLVSASYDTHVRLWDLRSGSSAPAQVLCGARDSVSAVMTNADEIVAASIDGCLRTYDVRQGQVIVDCLEAPVSRDGECLLTACLDGILRLVDKASGDVLATYSGHENAVYKVDCAVLHDDSMVVSGSEDGRLCFWDLAGEGKDELVSRKTGNSPVCAVAAHPSQSMVVSGAHDGSVRVWTV